MKSPAWKATWSACTTFSNSARRGWTPHRRAAGHFYADGIRPNCLERLRNSGITLPERLFEAACLGPLRNMWAWLYLGLAGRPGDKPACRPLKNVEVSRVRVDRHWPGLFRRVFRGHRRQRRASWSLPRASSGGSTLRSRKGCGCNLQESSGPRPRRGRKPPRTPPIGPGDVTGKPHRPVGAASHAATTGLAGDPGGHCRWGGCLVSAGNRRIGRANRRGCQHAASPARPLRSQSAPGKASRAIAGYVRVDEPRLARGGQTVSQAMQVVADQGSPPVSLEFYRCHEQMNLGMTPETAFHESGLAHRHPGAPDFHRRGSRAAPGGRQPLRVVRQDGSRGPRAVPHPRHDQEP